MASKYISNQKRIYSFLFECIRHFIKFLVNENGHLVQTKLLGQQSAIEIWCNTAQLPCARKLKGKLIIIVVIEIKIEIYSIKSHSPL